MNNLYNENTDELSDNLIAVLNIVKESLDKVDQARLVQVLSISMRSNEVSGPEWMLDAMEVILRGIRIMSLDQLGQWDGVRSVIESCPMELK